MPIEWSLQLSQPGIRLSVQAVIAADNARSPLPNVVAEELPSDRLKVMLGPTSVSRQCLNFTPHIGPQANGVNRQVDDRASGRTPYSGDAADAQPVPAVRPEGMLLSTTLLGAFRVGSWGMSY